eukprot:gb/GFBE01012369.1/.p1 GENE.gb/GFBE01012369.1/~~gb/GFBE01012369.1/.p1  ORF type:complete len:378 (+),score=101.27 gb/GFBE01012369.1/:1-1134(+)
MACLLLRRRVMLLVLAVLAFALLRPTDASAPTLTMPESGSGKKKDPMNELLHWAIEHSDPEKLKELMHKYKENNLTLKDVYDQEVIDAMFKSEADVMIQQIAVIKDFRNASLEEGYLQAALEELEENLHQIDNAGNLHGMGGMRPLLELAMSEERSDETRSLALWCLGAAVQNNGPVQRELFELGGLKQLAERLPDCGGAADSKAASAQFCGKLLFTLSGLVKNDAMLQAEADSLGVTDWLLDVGAHHAKPAIVKKALGSLDIILAQNSELAFLDRLPKKREAVSSMLLARVKGADGADLDIDTAEKALALTNRVLSLRPLLFPANFRQALAAASSATCRRCEDQMGAGDELCADLKELADQADRVLAAQQISDEEL